MVPSKPVPPGTKFVSHVLSDGFCPFEHTRFYEVYSAETSRNSPSISPSVVSRKNHSFNEHKSTKCRSKSEERRPHLNLAVMEIDTGDDGTVVSSRRNFLPTTRRVAHVPKYSAGDSMCSTDELLLDSRANISARKCHRSQSVKAVLNGHSTTLDQGLIRPDSTRSQQSFSAEALHNLLQVQMLRLKDQILGKSPKSSRKIHISEAFRGVNNSWGSDRNDNEFVRKPMEKVVLSKSVTNVCRMLAGCVVVSTFEFGNSIVAFCLIFPIVNNQCFEQSPWGFACVLRF